MKDRKKIELKNDLRMIVQDHLQEALEKLGDWETRGGHELAKNDGEEGKESSEEDKEPSFGHVLRQFEENVEEFKQIAKSINTDSEEHVEIEEINTRLAKVERLRRKLNMDFADMEREYISIEKKLSLLEKNDELEQIEQELEAIWEEAFREAYKLHISRKEKVVEFEEKIYEQIKTLGMEHARLLVELTPEKINFDEIIKEKDNYLSLSVYGLSKLCFLYRSSTDGEGMPIKKIASGGELSRLMLALKVVLNEKIAISTLMFDEVDAGIGGEVANRVGEKLVEMARNKQVIVITHLPQIARFADAHYSVKRDGGEGVSIIRLSEQMRFGELARMLGKEDSPEGLNLARQMINSV